MFRASFERSVAASGHVVLPVVFRAALPEADHGRVVLTRGLVGAMPCLEIRTASAHATLAADTRATDEEAAAYRRFQLASACACRLDRRGRMLLPKNLRAYVQLGSRVLLLASIDAIVVIDPQAWACREAETTEALTQGANTVRVPAAKSSSTP